MDISINTGKSPASAISPRSNFQASSAKGGDPSKDRRLFLLYDRCDMRTLVKGSWCPICPHVLGEQCVAEVPSHATEGVEVRGFGATRRTPHLRARHAGRDYA